MVRLLLVAGSGLAALAVLMTGLLVAASGAGTKGGPGQELLVDGRPSACASVASTAVAQEQGLRGALRSAPPMAFVFHRPGRYGFWMAGVSQPITVAWVAANRLIGAVAMVPESHTVFEPPIPVRLAIEFMAGRGLPAIGSKLSLGAACRP